MSNNMQRLRAEFSSSEFSLRNLLRIGSQDCAKLEVGTAVFPKGYRHPESGVSIHAVTEVSLILEGSIEIECEGETVRLEAGDVIVIPAGKGHVSHALAESRIYFLLFDADGL